MRKILSAGLIAIIMSSGAWAGEFLGHDTSDPLFILGTANVLSKTELTFGDSILQAGQYFTYGVSDRLSLGANVHYQFDFDDGHDGFAPIDFGGVYRLNTAADNNHHLITDVILGLKFGGSSHVRTPYFADSTYYAGLRFGRQWTGLTLAATIKSSWIFDDARGMAYIDFAPSAYFRILPDWRLGADFIWRKATNPHYDQEWLGGKIVRQYGRTQYVVHLDYEFENQETKFGTHVNILF